MAKPRIMKTRLGRWSCSMCNTEIGLGSTPQEAYQDWRQENVGRCIDLGRYAGTYGGTRQDRDVAAYAGWWMSVWEANKRFIVGGLVSAVILWLLWG